MMQSKERSGGICCFTDMRPATVPAGVTIALKDGYAHRIRDFPDMYLSLTIFLKQTGPHFKLRSA
ncbi:TPA: hypothetical protein ACHTOV_004445 [Enterobacter cancerogenus]|uniref:hypothetical protein n=1 Tax=Enterobacter cancerogenus TaxID=69218 RepID=UPI0020A65180|nr:hypothetical protein [Enterobacter cancerogenus]